ncbi:MAG: TolC family protein [Bacteroidota bacterium]
MINSIKYSFLIKLFLAGVLSLFSNGITSQVYSLQQLLQISDTANPSIRNAKLDIEINGKQKNVYLAARFPKITATGDYKYNALIPGQVVPAAFFGGTPGTYSTVKFGVPYNLGNTVQLTQIIYNSQLDYGLAVLDINKKIVDLQLKVTQDEIKYQIASAYFNLQALNKQKAFIDSNILNIDKLIVNMNAMVKQGLLTPLEIDKLTLNKLSLQNAIQNINSTKQQVEDALCILTGIPLQNRISILSDELIEKTILVDTTTIYRPQLDLLEAQKQMNLEENKGNKMAYLPNLSFYAAYNYTYNLKPEDNFRTGIESAFIGLRLDWTLFDGLEKHYKQKMNVINREKLENQEVYLKQQLEQNTLNARREIDNQSNALRLTKNQLELAQKVYRQTENLFKQGTISTNDLIQADNGVQQAQSNLINTYVKLRQAEIQYLKSIGNIK